VNLAHGISFAACLSDGRELQRMETMNWISEIRQKSKRQFLQGGGDSCRRHRP
jgi:hypothetical protein